MAGIATASPPPARPSGAPRIQAPASANYTSPCGIESQDLLNFRPATISTEPGAAMLTAEEVKQGTQLDVPYLIGVIGQTFSLKARLKLKPDGRAVPNHTVHFWIDGRYLGHARTDGQGNAQVSYKAEAFAAMKVQARYFGSDVCAGSKGENTLEMTKAPSKITFTFPTTPSTSVPAEHQFTLEGHVTCTSTGNSRVVPEKTVVVFLDGQPSSTAPGWHNFTFSWPYTPPPGSEGNHRVEARFPGNDACAATSASVTLAVKPPPVPARLQWYSVEGNVGQNVTVTTRLTVANPMRPFDPLPKDIPGVQISVMRERGKEWPLPRVPAKWLGKAVTDSSGVARITFRIDDQPMVYTLRAVADNVASVLDVENNVGMWYPTLTVHEGP
jgi:hypothetical protein